MTKYIFTFFACLMLAIGQSCSKDDTPVQPETPSNPSNPNKPDTPDTPDKPDTPDTPDNPDNPDDPDNGEDDQPVLVDFAKGADVSWVTQMEDAGYKFKYINGENGDLFEILKYDCGVNSTRFRVWVDPTKYFDSGAEKWNVGNNYNSIEDVVGKAQRAAALEMDIMIDFHFSDSWADPGKQNIPSSWMPEDGSTPTIEHLQAKMTEHINDMLGALKAVGITPNWVQIGNEVTYGMLSPVGQNWGNGGNDEPAFKNFVALVNAGFEAVKAFSEDIITIVHIDNAWNWDTANWFFGYMQKLNAKYDMIGLSLYPSAVYLNGSSKPQPVSEYMTYVNQALTNVTRLNQQYDKPVMFVEVGMPWDYPDYGANMLTAILEAARTNDMLKGVFWWEPESNPNNSGGYTMGATNADGSPNGALAPFLKF
ncbi:MAG: glycosyl hydrolase 53 family protein [Muribaculaceae bacterium]|nr:glycosyl hydrolase 53 family protein [Muribaculaceae bacterium]